MDYQPGGVGPTAVATRPRRRSVTCVGYFNGLYNLADFDQKRATWAAKYGNDKFKRAQAAALACEDRDLNGIEELMVLESTRGVKAVRQACSILGAKKPDNPKRTMKYLLATARKVRWE